MSYVLYGDNGSGSAIVELTLAEIGAPVDVRTLSLEADEQRGRNYGEINAQQKLPTLITPDGETLTESAAILLTLADRHPAAGLLPSREEPLGAYALRWLLFIAAEVYPLIEIIDYPQRFVPGAAAAEHRELVRGQVRRLWKQRLKLVENAFADDPWFLASGFSGLDLYLAVVSRWAQVDEWRKMEVPRIERLAQAVAARPACRDVWRRHFPE